MNFVIRNIIFDWSGTLVDDLPAVLKASNYVQTQAGRPEMTLDQFRAEFSLPFTNFYDRHVPEVPMEQLEGWFHSSYRRVQDSVRALPYAREFLEFCRERKLRTFLLSSVHHEHFDAQCRATGFGVFFDKPYTDVLDKRTKIRDILAGNHLCADETLFIGDMEHDIETAHHGARMDAVARGKAGFDCGASWRAAPVAGAERHESQARGGFRDDPSAACHRRRADIQRCR